MPRRGPEPNMAAVYGFIPKSHAGPSVRGWRRREERFPEDGDLVLDPVQGFALPVLEAVPVAVEEAREQVPQFLEANLLLAARPGPPRAFSSAKPAPPAVVPEGD